jgi:hypothetical protein
MAVAMWKATKYASYILGDYEVKVLRKHKTAMKTEQEGLLKSCLHQLLKAPKAASEKKVCFGVYAKVVSNIFGKATKVLPSSHMLYVARQEGLRKWLKSYFKTV